MPKALKPLGWIGGSRDDLGSLPGRVQDVFGYALYLAQRGEHPRNAKPLKGFGGSGVVEVVEDHDRSTYRAVYTVKFARVVYVLHVFQKKAKRGNATPNADIKLIERRLRLAQMEYEQWQRAGSRPLQ